MREIVLLFFYLLQIKEKNKNIDYINLANYNANRVIFMNKFP
ncbi:hypothetical protein J2T18_001440 [Paenibacillus polymyxa]|nr:hypothetical protein [Paenibacillus polymyxa]